ncbi:MAG: tetratricopeptide repeat protein [Limisphaerales bacterium]
MARTDQSRSALGIAVLLAVVTLAAYWPVLNGDFIRLDDGAYVVRNPQVREGLNWANVAWAFRSGIQGNWHPLTWLSHMLDVNLFGLWAGGHHLVNLLFHVLNSLLLFLWLRRATGALWRSAMVGALFALHPLHVESVAWVSERKDVLSAFFFLLMLWSYLRYARARGTSSGTARSALWYSLTLLLFVLGLMSKPMLVTAPFVLLLLDRWPLERTLGPRRLLFEKVPMFCLAFVSSVVTYRVQAQAHTTWLHLPVGVRLDNAVVSYVKYLAKTLWPAHLAVFYPHPDLAYPESHQWPAWGIGLALLLLLALSAWVLSQTKRAPWLAVGWFWYLGTLVPVIGLVQVGLQGMADRYTYIPLIGIFLAAVWGVDEFVRRPAAESPGGGGQSGFAGPRVAAALAAVALIVCVGFTRRQAGYWRTNLGLFEHALDVTPRNALAQFHIGSELGVQGQFTQAEAHFEAAVAADPTFAQPYFSLGLILDAQGKPRQAVTNFQQVIKLWPDWPAGYNQLAWLRATHPQAEMRDGREAVRLAERACELAGGKVARFSATLAAAYAEAGRFQDATNTAERARAMALATGDKETAQAAEAQLACYRQQRPFRDTQR